VSPALIVFVTVSCVFLSQWLIKILFKCEESLRIWLGHAVDTDNYSIFWLPGVAIWLVIAAICCILYVIGMFLAVKAAKDLFKWMKT
jgi:hypothetical protein